MAKRRTKKQKIKSSQQSHPIMATVPVSTQDEKVVADLLMSQPSQIKQDLGKTLIVTVICLVIVGLWYWRLKIVGY